MRLATSSVTSGSRRDYVLVIDDEPAIVELLVALLYEDEGFPVHTAHSVRQLLAHAPADPPGLILLDATLPGESADEVVPSLRRLPGWVQTPIVLCSGQDCLREIAERVGATTYLSKPFSLDTVAGLAHRYISPVARDHVPHLP
jgi:DNA-binding response OmpR family regulator